MIDYSIRSRLELGARSLGTPLSSEQADSLCIYLGLLQKWNKAYNLTAVRDAQQMVGLHLLDSLAIVPHLVGQSFIDVGTGAGLPGLVVAILKPEARLALLDSNGKKTRFLNQVIVELALGNLEVIHSRALDYRPEQRYDGVLSRAFATLKDMTDNAAHLLASDGRFWAMKGRYPQQEIEELELKYRMETCRPLQIPEVDAERHLIELSMARN